VEKRNALSTTARRAGYVGCYFVLDRIPPDARIPIVENARPISSSQVRKAYNKIRSLEELNVEKRGWTLDVLNAIHSLKKKEFSLLDAYTLEPELFKLHPANRHVRPKIANNSKSSATLAFSNSSAPDATACVEVAMLC